MGTKSWLLIVFFLYGKIVLSQDTTQFYNAEREWQNYVNTIDLDEGKIAQEENPSPSSLLLAGRNYFLNTYSFSFLHVNYHQRGYENYPGKTYANGIPINNLETNYVQYSLFSGMNHLFKVEVTSEQLAASDFSYGGLGNHFALSTSPMNQRNKLRISYTLSNRNYQHRLAATYNNGFDKKGWNYLLAVNARYSAQGYYPGTYYNGIAFLLSVDKKIKKNVLSFSIWASDYEIGRHTATVRETFELIGSNYYNPQWGYQNGKKRNANILHSFLPTSTVRYKANFSDKICWNSAFGVTQGKVTNSGLEWYNAPDPRPDYYRYLPSYFKGDAYQYDLLANKIKGNPDLLQINWDRLYQVNQSQATGRALYALGNRTTEMYEVNIASTISAILHPIWTLNAGVEYQQARQRHYKEMHDLLGGKYWTNVNAFIERDNPADITTIQNDVDHPNAKIYVGDKYGYDYTLYIRRFSEWIQLNLNKRKYDAFGAFEFNLRQLSREGNVRNGLFPNNSFGKDLTLSDFTWNGKFGFTYKIDGRKYLFANAAILQQPSVVNLVYVSPATRNFRNNGIRSMNIKTVEAGFILNAPTLKVQENIYYTLIKNAGEFRYFYDDIHQNFASYILTDIAKKHYGLELSLEWTFIPNWTYSFVSSFSKSLYSNRPNIIVTSETSSNILLNEQVYLKNYRISNTPQTIVHSDIGYRNGGAFFTIDVNLFFDRWAGLNPMRRISSILQDINIVTQKEIYDYTIKQERLPNGYTIDFFSGYSFFIKKYKKNNYYVDLLISGNNLLGKKNIISYAYEQMRMDTKGYDLNKFPNKYSYAMGRNYSLNIAFRF